MEKYEYLNLLPKNLDPIQKEACCATGNSVVAAGAGSGKTQVLATRFAWLVMSENIPASQILTLTFTKKAAGEMYRRIYDTLSFFAHNDKTPSLEKKRAFQALEDFSEVHIQTLDSYCSGIVKQAANIYGIRPDFSAGSSDSKQEIRNLALPFVFEHKNNLAVQTYAQSGKFQDFANDFLAATIEKYTSLITPHNYFEDKLNLQEEKILFAWNRYVTGKIIGNENLSPELLKMENKMEEAAATRNVSFIKNYKSLAKQIQTECENAFSESTSKYMALAKPNIDKSYEYNDFLNKNFETKDALFSEEGIKTAQSILQQIDCFSFSQATPSNPDKPIKNHIMYFKDALQNTVKGICYFIIQHNQTKALFELFDEFLASVNKSKRISGNLTFKDISELALKVLQENPELLLQEQNSFSRIMIDEFQDNNGKNRDLLFLLCGNQEKLFFVGDEKQSIYKFRGADVSVFNELRTLPVIKEPSPMTYNYRSSLEMLTAFNLMFEGDFSIFNNKTTELFEAKYLTKAYKYDPLKKQVMKFPILTDKTVPIHACLLNKDLLEYDMLSEKDQQSFFIAKTISEKLAADSSLSASDFAILDKNRTDRAYITKWLNYFNIDYTQDQNNSLFQDGPVNDIYNYLRLCVYPTDKSAMAAYLASPFCGKSITEVLNEMSSLTSLYLPLRKIILSQPLCKTISDLWIQTGYYYETLLNQNTAQFAEQFDMLFELARNTDESGKSIAWFVDQLAIIKDSETSSFSNEAEIETTDLTYPIEKNNSVQIMTIHKSKGLQFKHVFIYGCINIKTKSEKAKIFFEEETGPSIADAKANNYFYTIQKSLAEAKELAEFRRLLYVAITRAIDSIYIVGSWKQVPGKYSKKDDSYPTHLLEQLIRHYYPESEKQYTFGMDKTEYVENAPFDFSTIPLIKKTDAYAMVKLFERKKSIDFQQVQAIYSNEPTIILEEPVSNRKTPSSLEKEYDCGKREDGDAGKILDSSPDYLSNGEFTAADFGTLIHSYLEMQAKGMSPEDYVPEPKLFKNLGEKAIDEKKQLCILMCHEFSNHEIGKKFEAAKNAGLFYKAEWAFRMFHDETIFTGSIDLIFQNANGTYTIVDYKSDNEINVEKYRGQQECYRHAASKLLNIPKEKIECVLYFLKHKTLCQVFEQ